MVLLSYNYCFAQQTIDDYGFIENLNNGNFRMNSVESNISNYSTVKDWELSLAFRSIMNGISNINLSRISIGKKLENHYLYLRYTPGIKQEYQFNSRAEFIVDDSVQNYKTYLTYSEKYGFGYSRTLSEKLTMGISMRYFQQEFTEEYPAYFSNDTTSIIQIRSEHANKHFWRGDFGIEYLPFENLALSLSSVNLIIIKDFDAENNRDEFNINTSKYNIREIKGAVFGIKYFPTKALTLSGKYETNTSFVLGTNYNFSLNNANVTIGSAVLHDKNQLPFITAVYPSISYSNSLFNLTVSYLKYFEDRSEVKSLSQFNNYGIHNIQNNYFSADRVNLMLNFALSFRNNRQVKFIDLKINSNIFPTFKDNYIDQPIATGRIVNLTDKIVSIKPSCFIDDVTSEQIYSPIQSIQPYDTLMIPFFILIDNKVPAYEKTKISHAKFYITTLSEEPDDEMLKPILVHQKNNWDGNVINLRYFVKSDIDYSNRYAKEIFDTRQKNIASLSSFEKIKLLFNEFVKKLVYVSDRRAAIDFVQFPSETIELRGGDCDDLSVCLSSLLESIGIQTAFIDYKPKDGIGHVTLLVNTNLSPGESDSITINERKFLVRKNFTGVEEIWIPIEVTSLTNFDEAWSLGSEKFYTEAIDHFGLSKNSVEIVDVY